MTERELCYDTLYRIHVDGELSHITLKNALDSCDKKYPEINKSFVAGLVNGVNERYLTLMYLIEKQAGRPVGKIKPALRIMLAMGVYQAYYMSVPKSAACNETVKLACKRGFSGLKGFVNGVLRGMFRNIPDVEAFLDSELENLNITEKLSIRYSCPQWLVSHYCNECGEERAEKLLSSSFDRKPLTIYRLRQKISEQQLFETFETDSVEIEKINDVESGYKILSPCHVASLEAYKKGYIIVQDLSSMLAVELLPEMISGEILDLCAAPGGKTIHCADRFPDCRVTAGDLTENKVELIHETIIRTGINNVNTRVADATVENKDDVEKYDLVIADLPCSGLGVIGRKPDIKYKTKPEDIESLAVLQREILKNAVSYVKPGGFLAYSTCTVAKAENEANADYISELGFEPYGFEDRISDVFKQYLKAPNRLQLLPDERHDGFYIALFRKKQAKQ
ncbi:MAG: 16S rRNA (cytosine(967)-C(5))-methyltransferase RsmB [Lachnospiraceae bacterium]